MAAAPDTSTRLQSIGHRLTGPRRAVLQAIAAAHAPFTIEDICSSAPSVGRATVFRTMKMLQEMEVVCRVPLEDGSVRYQLSEGGHHHHLVCSRCGAVREFSDPDLDRLIHRNAAAEHFRLDGHSLELYGLCETCAGG